MTYCSRFIPQLILTFCISVFFILTGCADSRSNSQTNAKPKIIAHGLYTGMYDLVVGHSHHILEATTEEHDAQLIIHAREGKIETFDKSPAQVIESVYQSRYYQHFGNAGEDKPPLCRVDDQDEIEVAEAQDGLLNTGQPSEPVQCTLDGGIHVYAISWGE